MVVTYRVNGNDVPRSLLVPPQNLSQRDVQKAHIVIAQNDESDLRSEFVLVLGRSDDGEVRGRHKSGFDLGERHDRFLMLKMDCARGIWGLLWLAGTLGRRSSNIYARGAQVSRKSDLDLNSTVCVKPQRIIDRDINDY